MPRSARQAFLQSPLAAEFGKMAETAAFDTATEYALLTFLEELPVDGDPNAGWGRDCQRIGATRVLQLLRTIHLKQETPQPYRPPSLKPPK